VRAEFVGELRALPRVWYLWLLPPVAVVLAWWLVPLNADIYATFADFDAQSTDEIAGEYGTDVALLDGQRVTRRRLARAVTPSRSAQV
jgi:hypothetical protein